MINSNSQSESVGDDIYLANERSKKLDVIRHSKLFLHFKLFYSQFLGIFRDMKF